MLLECLRDREADVLRFLSDLQIPPTSNQAERDLRPAKTQQKISGRLRSEKAARDRYAIRGYASTAAKHAPLPWPRSATHSPETPGCRRFQRSPDPASRESRNATSNNTAEAA
jgi:hypothetical protein